jgi:ppGpp synthetase/RelA/SpoT-type nucleotidyltranferase
MRPTDLFDEFLASHDALERRCAALRDGLDALLTQRGIKVHLVSGRVKSPASLRHKLSRPDRTYARLWDLTDLVGLRVTTYFEDAIEAVARAIEEGFAVDYGHSTDKLRFKDHGRFGYRSLHYVCSLGGDGLPAEARFEIQVRTVVQHAWAEVEHDLGYKSHDAVPEAIRRRFSRVASLLEIADEEFVAIRRELEAHQRSAAAAVADPARPFPLDAVSLPTVARCDAVCALDQAIAAMIERPLVEEVFFPEYLARMLRLTGLTTTADVDAALQRHGAEVTAIVRPYFDYASRAWKLTASSLDAVHRGYSLFFLSHVVIVRGPERELSKVGKLTQLYRELDYPNDERQAQRVASELLATLQRAS